MPQVCNCIAEFNDKRAPEQELDASITFSRTSNEMLLTTYTPLRRKGTGKLETRSKFPRLAVHTFCPFCGTSLKGDWRPVIGQPVQATEAFLEHCPEYRGETYFVVGVHIDRSASGQARDGLEITVSEEWPVTSNTLGFTDGFYINRAGKSDDLEPVRVLPSEEGKANG